MARTNRKLNIRCTDTDCKNDLHCFRATPQMIKDGRKGLCQECGAKLVNWERISRKKLSDVNYTFRVLKLEMVRHFFWHVELGIKAINHARRKGKHKLKEHVSRHLSKAIAPASPYKDGFQTPMREGAPTVIPYAQHATATCCRTCLEYWHDIEKGTQLSNRQIEYLTELVCLYVEDRIPELTEDGETIPPLRRANRTI